MPLFKKKPIVVFATQWFPGSIDARVRKALQGDASWEMCPSCGKEIGEHGVCDTLEGKMIACPSDWIITGIRDECYPCKPSVFQKTYEYVSP